MKYIELKNINITYNNKIVLSDFNLSLDEGEILLIQGKSGIGKTSLLRALAGLISYSGTIILNNVDISKIATNKRGISLLFQNYALFPHMTVEKNIEYGITHLSKADRKKEVDYLLNLINMEEHRNRYPNSLSGGEKQRVALARSLAVKPNLLLLDEPFSSIDEELKEQLRAKLKEILKKLNITTIIVSHDVNDSSICDRTIKITEK